MYRIIHPTKKLIKFIYIHYIYVGIENNYFNSSDMTIDYENKNLSISGFNAHKNLNFDLSFTYNYSGNRCIGLLKYWEIDKIFKFEIYEENGIYKTVDLR